MEDEVAERIDWYWLKLDESAVFLISTHRKTDYTVLKYQTKKDLLKLLSFPENGKVTLAEHLDSGESSTLEITLKEACEKFGSKIMAQPVKHDKNYTGPKAIDILSGEGYL